MNFVKINLDEGELYINLSSIARALFSEDSDGSLVARVRFLDTEGSPHQSVVTPATSGLVETFRGQAAEQLRAALDESLDRRKKPRILQ